MKLSLEIVASLLLLAGMAGAQQSKPAQESSAQPGQQPAAQPGSQQPSGQQPATQPGSQQPGAQSGQQQPAQPGAQQAESTPEQHPDYPAGPGMIEGCLTRAGAGYAIQPDQGEPKVSLRIERNISADVGEEVKVYGYPADAAAGAPSPGAAGELQGNAGAVGAQPGGSHFPAPATGADQPGAAAGAMAGGAQAAASSQNGEMTFRVIRYVPLQRACSGSTSQQSQQPATAPQSAGE